MASAKYYSVMEHTAATDSYAVMSDIKLTFLCSHSINESLNMHAHTFTNKPSAGIHRFGQKSLLLTQRNVPETYTFGRRANNALPHTDASLFKCLSCTLNCF